MEETLDFVRDSLSYIRSFYGGEGLDQLAEIAHKHFGKHQQFHEVWKGSDTFGLQNVPGLPEKLFLVHYDFHTQGVDSRIEARPGIWLDDLELLQCIAALLSTVEVTNRVRGQAWMPRPRMSSELARVANAAKAKSDRIQEAINRAEKAAREAARRESEESIRAQARVKNTLSGRILERESAAAMPKSANDRLLELERVAREARAAAYLAERTAIEARAAMAEGEHKPSESVSAGAAAAAASSREFA